MATKKKHAVCYIINTWNDRVRPVAIPGGIKAASKEADRRNEISYAKAKRRLGNDVEDVDEHNLRPWAAISSVEMERRNNIEAGTHFVYDLKRSELHTVGFENFGQAAQWIRDTVGGTVVVQCTDNIDRITFLQAVAPLRRYIVVTAELAYKLADEPKTDSTSPMKEDDVVPLARPLRHWGMAYGHSADDLNSFTRATVVQLENFPTEEPMSFTVPGHRSPAEMVQYVKVFREGYQRGIRRGRKSVGRVLQRLLEGK